MPACRDCGRLVVLWCGPPDSTEARCRTCWQAIYAAEERCALVVKATLLFMAGGGTIAVAVWSLLS
jgi:hypothetical protein